MEKEGQEEDEEEEKNEENGLIILFAVALTIVEDKLVHAEVVVNLLEFWYAESNVARIFMAE